MKYWDRREPGGQGVPPRRCDSTSSQPSRHRAECFPYALTMVTAKPRRTRTERHSFLSSLWTELLFWAPSLLNGRNLTSAHLGPSLPPGGYILSSRVWRHRETERGVGVWYHVRQHPSTLLSAGTCWFPPSGPIELIVMGPPYGGNL